MMKNQHSKNQQSVEYDPRQMDRSLRRIYFAENYRLRVGTGTARRNEIKSDKDSDSVSANDLKIR